MAWIKPSKKDMAVTFFYCCRGHATHTNGSHPKRIVGFTEQRFHEYDPSRANERWRALTPRLVIGQVTLIDLEDFYARWQRLLPLSNETPPQVIWEQLLSQLPWIKEKVVETRPKIARAVMWLSLVALTLCRVALHLKRNSGTLALNVALRFLRLFPIQGEGDS